jgi:hypothetical protein
MLLEKDGNKIYIKYYKENYIGYISGIIMTVLFGIFLITGFDKINLGNKLLDNVLHNSFIKSLFIIGVIIFIIISMLNKIFYSDYNYYIDLMENNIHLIRGKWKFKNDNIINIKNIKKIVILKTEESVNKYGKAIDLYKIDLYDNELNAYEIYDDYNYPVIVEMVKELNKIIDSEILEKIDVNDYEGFRKRIV